RPALDPRGLAVGEDVPDVGERLPSDANGEPRQRRGPQLVENGSEAGGPGDEERCRASEDHSAQYDQQRAVLSAEARPQQARAPERLWKSEQDHWSSREISSARCSKTAARARGGSAARAAVLTLQPGKDL